MISVIKKVFGQSVDTQPPAVRNLTLVKPKAEKINPDQLSQNIDAYESLAGEIGFRPAALVAYKLRVYLSQNSHPVYPLASVEQYMDRLCHASRIPDSNRTWDWYPLRPKDRRRGGVNINLRPQPNYGVGMLWAFGVYQRAVPLRVLELVSEIEAHMPDDLEYYVTDYRVASPDPFIMAIPRGSEERRYVTVIAVWDEPTFFDDGK